MTNIGTPLEEAAAQLRPGHRVGVQRENAYDPEYALFHLPTNRSSIAVDPGPSTLPRDEWVRASFLQLVVGDKPRTIRGSRPPTMSARNQRRRIEITAFPLLRYLEVCEHELVFGGLVDSLIGEPARPTEEKFVSIVSNNLLGNTANRHSDLDAIRTQFGRCLDDEAPLQLLLPSMPFKDQCPFRTEVPADRPDLGEAAFLIRMHCLALAVNQIHKFDSECVIVCDGTAYAPIFDVDLRAASMYMDQLRHLRATLNLAKSINLLDLMDLVNLDNAFAVRARFKSFTGIRKTIRRQLEALRTEDPGCAQAFTVLVYAMKWNLNTRRYLESEGDYNLWRALRRRAGPRSGDSQELKSLISLLTERAEEAALDYASFNLALKFSNLLARYFPNAIRLTTHPKPGQVSAPRLSATSPYPWNGVAVATTLDESGLGPTSISCIEAYAAIRGRLRPVFERSGSYPVCYSK